MKRALPYLLPGALLGLILIIRWALISWGFWHDGFLVPPGGDPASHLELISRILANEPLSSYPPGFHLSVAFLAELTGRSPLELLKLIAPVLTVLPVLGVYVLVASWVSPRAGLFAAALLGLTGVSPVIAFADGNYPNLIGTFLVTINLTLLGLLIRYPTMKYGLLCLGSLLLLTWFHHATLFVWVLVVLPTLLGFLFLRSPELARGRRFVFTRIVPFLVVLVGFGVWQFGPMILALLQSSWTAAMDGVIPDPLALPLQFHQYPEVIGSLIWQLGLIGLAFLALEPKLKPEQRLLLLAWFIVPFLVSRTSWAGAPARLSRELAIPLSVSAGILLSWMFDAVPARLRSAAIFGVGLLLFLNTAMWTAGIARLPEGFSPLIWWHADDDVKQSVLKRLPVGSTIAYAPSSPYYPALLPEQEFILPDADYLHDPEELSRSFTERGVDYLFVDTTILGNHDAKAYPYYNGYEAYRTALESFVGARTIVTFSDGSVLREIAPLGPARTP